MDPVQVPAYLAIALSAVAVLVVVLNYFKQLATKADINKLSDRLVSVENKLRSLGAGQASLQAGQAALEGRLSAVEKKADASHGLQNPSILT